MWRTCLVVLAVTTCWVCSAVAEKVDVEIGVLTCTMGGPGEPGAGQAPSEERTRDALCTFRVKTGAEETYAGRIQGVSISTDQKGALIWVVKSAAGAAVEPGVLQQVFATDAKKPADQKPPMIGEANSDIALHSMADKSEGSASATEKPAPTGFVILSVQLKLTSTSG